MKRNTIRTTAKVAAAALPVSIALFCSGVATAEAPQPGPVATPVAEGLPLEPVATDPNARFPDPALNGAAAGALTGSFGGGALGSVVGSIPGMLGGSALGALIGGGIGALVGLLDPNVIPQILP
ncbi:hypothetical protein LTV02_27635 [Nocardia yamanashiensis]|uniref:hypothetical protein n=1 Tax=Nocardia yamanashiensis TaxID=209247 RepID=UPI001E2F3D66|nr:hypothetical protein [Nocardia yamanashiensis]UGT39813.1 hypothetical protein LTV02_27635 [Nocardia yamanashiensis]